MTLPLYYLLRGLAPADPAAAAERAADLIRLEERLGIFREADLQGLIASATWLTDALNQVYLYGHLPFIGAVALWLYLRHRRDYLLLRNAILISGALGLAIYYLWPVAPPRLLPGFGFVDTVTQEYGVQRPGTPAVFVNHYAAVPSLHFGWNVLAALLAVAATRNAWTLAIAVVTPPLTLASIVLTANHFFLDAAAGLIAVAAGLGAALALRAWLVRRRGGHRVATAGGVDWLGWALGLAPDET